ncbi:conserved hypothetical protein with Carbohydrate binding domain [Vibrio nigripulchritudo SO65]|uniref:PKD domain-containing protein n=1 Tax=Vibrio nigripulchritudo TaxID=28173 RepID=UPI0003B20023|nr:PKD domain-containing protein [Vibrio nigripulchritudo]CCN34270.1 conserved hypothetical protein with Carbohydrate binding domain [Vibrio nigripulchritudo AM115]CCN44049.1 conserved hypothetical protein with Carbohydrate binding domain [Vibrio nigripulchritudo FTn2]CCN64247.1 conserved hypothetical protein with Carbohydrate binding domain [Vibrio nigripulchritudo POn4]CCN79022.1 conserved hypothetical protein with Carbohydrate binding domain [Vibrio nigripulchritudo SO65]
MNRNIRQLNKKKNHLMVISALAMGVATATSAFAAHDQIPDVLPTISEEVSAQLSLTASSALEESANLLYSPGASFIKVHFSQFQVPEGMAVEVSSPDRDEVLHYGPGLNTAKTYDSAAGDDGVNSFSAMSIQGDTVHVKVIGEAKDPNAVLNVVIDQYQKGKTQAEIDSIINMNPDGTESICGTDQKKAAVCYKDSHPTEFAHSKPVARLLIGGRSLCTAWRVGPDNLMMTNNHCVESAAEAASTEVWFNYQQASCGGASATTVKVQANKLLSTDYTLDYTLFNVKNFSQISKFGYLGLDPRIPKLSERIYIPQHPGGRKKELGIETDRGLCQVDRPVTNGRGTNTDAGYLCDTEGGSSGSPVLAAASNNVIALHHLGGCYNKGAHISKIWPKVSSHFPGGVPNSKVDLIDINQPPVADFTYTCNELACTFDASKSYDNDGSIVQYAWSYGNGSTGKGVKGVQNYVANGTYTVKLTVTDNGGKSASYSQKVSVKKGSNGGTCPGLATWDAGTVYLTGDTVQHNGVKYQAEWWTQGADPEKNSGPWDVWKDLGACN